MNVVSLLPSPPLYHITIAHFHLPVVTTSWLHIPLDNTKSLLHTSLLSLNIHHSCFTSCSHQMPVTFSLICSSLHHICKLHCFFILSWHFSSSSVIFALLHAPVVTNIPVTVVLLHVPVFTTFQSLLLCFMLLSSHPSVCSIFLCHHSSYICSPSVTYFQLPMVTISFTFLYSIFWSSPHHSQLVTLLPPACCHISITMALPFSRFLLSHHCCHHIHHS